MDSDFDKMGTSYWDGLWMGNSQALPALIDPDLPGVANYVNRAKHRLFIGVINRMTPRPVRFLEIGCANSVWMPYFARQFGLEVWGLDYSEIGCARSREILARARVAGQVICSNLFEPPREMIEFFDLVASFGVVEHFEDTSTSVAACSRFLKPGGTMITMVPNMHGMLWLQKRIDRRIFDGHVALDSAQLTTAHLDAGLVDCDSFYLLVVNLGVLNFQGYRLQPIRRLATGVCGAISRAFWFVEEHGLKLTPNRVTSPLVACVARKPLSAPIRQASTAMNENLGDAS